MYKNLLSLIIFFLLISTTIFSQSNIGIGQWRSHLPYQFGRYVTQSESTIYYATDWSIVSIDKEERSVDFLSKDNGLSEVGIGLIKYDKALELLVVSYDNGVIDLVGTDEIITVTDISNFNNITINKTINDIFITNESIAYIAAGYGISRLDLKDGLFKSTTFTGINVNSVVVLDGIIYAGTDEGIYTINTDNAFLEVFDNWTLLDNNINLPLDYSTKAMTLFKGKLVFDVNDSLYTIENNLTKYLYHKDNRVINFLTSEGPNLLMGLGCLPDCGGTVVRFKNDSFIPESPGGGCVDRPLYAIEDEQQSVWFADQFRGIRVSEKFITGCSKTVYNSPYSQFSNELAIYENKLYVASSSLKDNGSPRDLADGFFTF
ncbi:MAG TPA: hypothetical protein ENI82_06395, partial [Bacteroidetes bacterium]|nr:hypothetical protein [Bacteroidota bacterium]